MTIQKGNTFLHKRNILICLRDKEELPNSLTENFCGQVFYEIPTVLPEKVNVYLCGNLPEVEILITNQRVYVIYTLSVGIHSGIQIGLGEVPLNIHNVGVFFPEFFLGKPDYFDAIQKSHEFQTLRE